MTLASAIHCYQQQMAIGRQLWSLFVLVCSAGIIVAYLEPVGSRGCATISWVASGAFAVFAVWNLAAQLQSIRLQTSLLERSRELAKREVSEPLLDVLSATVEPSRQLIVVVHVALDVLVIYALLLGCFTAG